MGCCNKSPQTGQPNTIEVCSLMVLKTRGGIPKSAGRCCPRKRWGRMLPVPSSPLAADCNLGHSLACRCVPLVSAFAHLAVSLLCVSVSRFPSSRQGNSCAGHPYPGQPRLITSAKTWFPAKVMFRGSAWTWVLVAGVGEGGIVNPAQYTICF